MAKHDRIRKISPMSAVFGRWAEMEYTACRTYRGITWYRTDFGHKGDREDWVADLPGLCVSVSRYRREKGWGIGRQNPTWEKEADARLSSARQHVVNTIKETQATLADLESSKALLVAALEEET